MLAAGATQSAARAAEAGGTCVHRPAPAGAKAKRVAIVVGNGAYTHGIPALPNPTNDAEATAKALAALGFETFSSTNVGAAALQICLDQAYASLADTEVAMLYYSGHGIQINDENYLVATDAGVGDFKHGFVPVQPIVDALQKRAKATLVLLDACRNNPMAEEGHLGLSVSTGRGLSRAKEVRTGEPPTAAGPNVQARGLMVAYSTSPNAVARDGTGHLSPFSEAFVKTVGTSGYSIQHVMGDVTRAVGEATQWEQTPWMKSSLTSELKLGGGETLEEAKSISDNHAARSSSLLDVDNNKKAATIEALKGLPAAPDAAALQRFSKAYLALYFAVQGGETVLPVSPGMNLVAISTRNRAAVLRHSQDFRSTTFELWSVSDQKVVAKPDVGSGATEEFTFSPHGKLLAVSLRQGTRVMDGLDGTKKFDVRGRGSSLAFNPDESRLLLTDLGDARITIVDVAAGSPSMVVGAQQLDPGPRKRRSVSLEKAMFGGNDKVCFAMSLGGNKSALGVYDLNESKSTRLREVDGSVNTMTCDPAGRYLVRTIGAGEGDQGMEIWDLTADKVSMVKASIANIMGIDPQGRYVSTLSMANEEQGFYELATGKKAYPPTVPEGYFVLGARLRDPGGGIVSQDRNDNPWRDWPDESLFGRGLVEHALAGLTPAQRAEVERDRITYTAVVAGNP